MTTTQLIGLAFIILACWKAWPRRNASPAAKSGSGLDTVLFTWARTPFLLRHLYQSVLILGAAGSGKTSGSGRFFLKVLLAVPNSGGLIIASKPEERADVIAAFRIAGREKDLLFLGPNDPLKCNFLKSLGGDANNVTNGIEVVAEMNSKQKGESKEPFWALQRKRLFYNTIVMLQLSCEEITGSNIQRFVLSAPTTPAQIKTPEWQEGYCNMVLKRAFAAIKESQDPRKHFDYAQSFQFVTGEWPTMADKTRSNIVAEASGVLHSMNSGVVRDLIGTDTTVSPEDMEKGKWLFCDMPLQIYGESGRMVGSTLKYITQRHILARHATGNAGPICIWVDEAHNYINSYDAIALAEQRSHRGVAVYLTQSIHAIYANLGEHFADALLTNFGGAKIFHQLGDSKSAQWASSLLGDRIDVMTGGSPDTPQGAFDTPIFKTSYNEQIVPVVQPAAFMTGLRTSGGIVDAIVIRSDPFASGERFAKVSFTQE